MLEIGGDVSNGRSGRLVRVAGSLAAALLLGSCRQADERPAIGPPAPAIGAPRELGPPVGPGSGEPDLAPGPDGSVLLSWVEPAPEGHALRFATLTNAGWSPARTVVARTDLFVNWADVPSVVALSDGSLAAHWLQRSGAETHAYGIRVSRSADGGSTWSAPVTPHGDGTPTEHGFVSLIPEPDGRVSTVWLDGRAYADSSETTPAMALRAATVSVDGSLSGETLLDPRTCDCCQTSTAIGASGTIVAYRGRTEDEVRDIRVARKVAGVWHEPGPVHADGWVIAACPVNGPAVDARDRTVAVAWFTAAHDRPRVLVAFSDDGGESFAAPIEVAGPGESGRPLGRVDLALTAGGAALVSWLHEREGSGAVLLAVVTPAGRAGPSTVAAETGPGRASGFPRILLRGEELLLAWTFVSGDGPGQVRVTMLPVEPGRSSSPS